MPNKQPSKKSIYIKGARVHNLKNINVEIPRNKFIVITGVSGSGKSSLAFDTLYAEGQRRYVESLSAYARQFMGKMNKPEVDTITGLSPAIAIEQKVISSNPRSTVGTTTEIYDYLKLFYARIGKTYSPVSGKQVKRHSVTDVVDHINNLPESTKVVLYAPSLLPRNRKLHEHLSILLQQGFSRVRIDQKPFKIEELIEAGNLPANFATLDIVIDRLSVKKDDEDNINRIADSVQTAFYEGDGECLIEALQNTGKESEITGFSNKFDLDGITFEEPSVHLFSFNNPYGACKTCEGYGQVIGIDENLVVPDKSLSVYDDAIACWRGEKMKKWKDKLVMNAYKFDFPVHRSYYELTDEERRLIWTGNQYFKGLNAFFKHLEKKNYKIQYRVMLSRYRGKTICTECHGTRLRGDASYVKIGNKSIIDLVLMPVNELMLFFNQLHLSDYDEKVAKRLLLEIRNRLHFLNEVGLGYLTLNRASNTLSGGESQRINLATSLGSSLVGSTYILDEPSIGLHPRDTERLINVLLSLRDIGNTVIVVEHDEEIMRSADQLIDMGPLAGSHGGEVVFSGGHKSILKEKDSLTAKYLTGKLSIAIPRERRKWKRSITLKGVRENNLKGFDAVFPLNTLTVVTGVSGSGKSSLVKNILYPSLKKIFGGYGEHTGAFDKMEGDYESISAVEFIDQNPIGKSSRSNPVTYVKAYDEIRGLFASNQLSKTRGYKPSHFSFNVDGGRCEVCQGEGEIKIEMQFMADIHLVCEECNGKRFKQEILEVKYRNKNISDILDMTIEDAIAFFEEQKGTQEKKIIDKLQPLADVGLGYVQLGQSSSTLSGGEAQRIKLASFLSKGNKSGNTLFIFDEPTTGLHFHDIHKLLFAFDALIKNGHSIIVVEHNPDVIKCADWILDLGPEGGKNGGQLVFEGTPEDLIKCKESHTGRFISEKLASKLN